MFVCETRRFTLGAASSQYHTDQHRAGWNPCVINNRHCHWHSIYVYMWGGGHEPRVTRDQATVRVSRAHSRSTSLMTSGVTIFHLWCQREGWDTLTGSGTGGSGGRPITNGQDRLGERQRDRKRSNWGRKWEGTPHPEWYIDRYVAHHMAIRARSGHTHWVPLSEYWTRSSGRQQTALGCVTCWLSGGPAPSTARIYSLCHQCQGRRLCAFPLRSCPLSFAATEPETRRQVSSLSQPTRQ